MPKTPTQQPLPDMPSEIHDPYQFSVVFDWGTFVFKLLSVRDSIQTRHLAEALYGKPLPVRAPDDIIQRTTEEHTAWLLAELEQAAVSVPEGWDWSNLHRFDKLGEVWRAYGEQGEAFLETMGGF